MVKVIELQTKEGKPYITEDGKVLKEYKLEKGDLFIPVYNKVTEKKNENDVTGEIYTKYSIKAKVKNSEGKVVKHYDDEEIFLTLTPTQANTLKKKLVEGIEINQELFTTYLYDSETRKNNVGIGIKGNNKPAKSFEDFETQEVEEKEEQ